MCVYGSQAYDHILLDFSVGYRPCFGGIQLCVKGPWDPALVIRMHIHIVVLNYQNICRKGLALLSLCEIAMFGWFSRLHVAPVLSDACLYHDTV